MRDKLPTGEIAEIVSEIEKLDNMETFCMSNEWLAEYAKDLYYRLTNTNYKPKNCIIKYE